MLAFLSEEPHDACVIGSGPAGAFVAHELVAAGARVVLVEAGEAVTPGRLSHLSPSAFKHRGSWEERQAPYYPDGIAGEVRYQTTAINVDRIRVLGGRSVHWNAVCLRFSPDDFRERSVGGIEEDWPISYPDLAPYYAYVERTIGVCGTREGLAVLPDGAGAFWCARPTSWSEGSLSWVRHPRPAHDAPRPGP